MRPNKPALEIIFSMRCIQKSTPFSSMPGFTSGSLATTGSSAEDFRMPFTTTGETMRFPSGGCWIYAAIPHGLRTNFGQYRRGSVTTNGAAEYARDVILNPNPAIGVMCLTRAENQRDSASYSGKDTQAAMAAALFLTPG